MIRPYTLRDDVTLLKLYVSLYEFEKFFDSLNDVIAYSLETSLDDYNRPIIVAYSSIREAAARRLFEIACGEEMPKDAVDSIWDVIYNNEGAMSELLNCVDADTDEHYFKGCRTIIELNDVDEIIKAYVVEND